ncbi:MAG: class I SAM-dependent methyltransferase [Polyangia bacterium]
MVSLRGHHVLADLLDHTSTVLDLGAHVGQFSTEIRERFGARCVAVEPNPVLCAKIPSTEFIRPFNCAVAGKTGPALFEVTDNLEFSHLQGDGRSVAGDAISIQAFTLPDLMRTADISRIDLLKVDIEGAEFELFDSLEDAFLREIGQITVEFHDFIASLSCGPDVTRVKERLGRLGFACIVFSAENNGDVLFVNRTRYQATPLQWFYLENVARYTRGLTRRAQRWLTRTSSGGAVAVNGMIAMPPTPSAVGGRTLEIFAGTGRLNAWVYSKLAAGVRGDVLEIGSGIGNLSRLILNDARHLVVTDVEPAYLDGLRQTFGSDPRVEVLRFDLDDAPPPELAQRRFDAIVAVNVIEHIRDDYTAVQRLADMLKPGGKLLVYVPACPSAFGSLDEALGHHRRYTPGMLIALLRGAGLDPLPPQYMNFFGLFGWIVNGQGLRRRVLSAQQVTVFDRLVPALRIEDRLKLPIGLGICTEATKRQPAN